MGHDHTHAAGRSGDRRRLRWALGVTLAILIVELVGAVLTGSLALLADAGHMATDAGGVILALGASYVAARPATGRSTFGYHRAEVLAALVNGLLLVVVCGYLAYAGVTRLLDPVEVEAPAMVAFAVVGLVANGISLAVLTRSATGSINMRGAIAEVFGDLIGSVFAIAAGVVIWVAGWWEADAIASLLIAAMIAPRAWFLMRDALRILLEIAPRDLDLNEVRRHIEEVDGVVDVHDLHAWTITSGLPSLSAHVTVTEDELESTGVGSILDKLSACTREHFEVSHVTFQIEPPTHSAHEDLGEAH